ncbi:DUF6525 family protein [Acetobacter orleanensis]|uniref:Uncharacterized protein n=1 Tax=Acetobacter orleanensis TaxID=104099 RepID=A0A4Y3TMK4_9PROT|nr:DUF6525 family protein [Acetobacter orleanensis]KXV65197.1 hypothetical protein AD949_04820 [Acetobacter orleanensis]PCD79661.1 hypothetical protein CO710_05490 [Acetobacter orleanensis]GAN68769.1 hypothetical protein Abol_021_124 [Acetobacter orleanensis JCM 7639]GBR28074.1 hypothetical protein AA0473_1631 [Acetobacter orleanensis NRIC 0473]GEB82257.1 hypothetical protein AOR01nite_07340 [Acetobacter orleanensis]
MPDIQTSNERTLRHEMWRRYNGDDWQAFDQLPPLVRQRVATHAYDAWSVNVLILWKHYKRTYGNTLRGQRALIRYLDYCERLERDAFAEHYTHQYGTMLPHDAACVSVLRNQAVT